MIRNIIVYKEYFVNFYKAQDNKVQEKIEYALDLVRFERKVPKKFFKALESTDGIFEVRVITTFKSIRILCFFDKGNLVVLTNCFVKKTKKLRKEKLNLLKSLKKNILGIKVFEYG